MGVNKMKFKILIAEDNVDTLNILKLYIDNSDFEVIYVDNGDDAVNIFNTQNIDLAIFDIMLPKKNGFELIKHVRKNSTIPILILSAKDQYSDKIFGLNLGADDYITKPFEPTELIARINSSLRRYYEFKFIDDQKTNRILTIGSLSLNLDEFLLTKNKKNINLTSTEYKILLKLMKNPGRVYTKLQLYESINGSYFENDDNTIMVHIFHLRNKIEDDPKNPKYIKTVRGIGYKIDTK